MSAGYGGVAVAAPVTFGYALRSERDVGWFIGSTLASLIQRAGVRKLDVDGLVIASYTLAPDHSASMAEALGLQPRFLADLPFGGASGVVALKRAARAVQAGDADVVACIAADVAPTGDGIGANFSRFARDHVYPYGAGGANSMFALITDRYMRSHGVSREDFGALCVAQRRNGMLFPGALMRTELSLQDYLAARPVCEPLHLFDCVRRCCGAEGFLVMSEERARSLQLPHALIAGAVEQHNGTAGQAVQTAVGLHGKVGDLYEQAGMGPEQADVIAAYDDYPVIVMLQLEALGLCEPGGAAAWLRAREQAGRPALNTNGGMLCTGQAGAAGGFNGLTEVLRQLTGQALGIVVPFASVGLVSCYGTINYDRGICASAAMLTTGSRA
ncbi:MAG: acetyl-CoA acetyltransferase [Rhizobacter sp.]|nr:acetyl-CoA acetyltransferase [Rhizobacter sp.]